MAGWCPGESLHCPAARQLPFSTDEVYVRRDEFTGDVILSPRPSLEQIFAAIDARGVAKDWEFERDRTPQPDRNLFGDD
jgi:hypothetical protein